MTVKEAGLERLRDTDLTLAEGEVDIRGLKVVDAEGTALGTVRALFVDPDEREVRFLVVRGGGILGLGDRERLIPVEAIRRVDDVVWLRLPNTRVAHPVAYQPNLVDQKWHSGGTEDWYGWWFGYPPFLGTPTPMGPRMQLPHEREVVDHEPR